MIRNKTAYLGLLTAMSLILSYIEMLLPFQVGIPGIKLGLANLAVVLGLYLFGAREAILLVVAKVCISGLLFGNLAMMSYSFAGAMLSILVMILMKKGNHFHIPTVSAAGGVAHNLGQLLVAFLVTETYGIVFYMPALLVAGLITGLVIGTVTALVLPAIWRIVQKGVRE